MIDIHTHLLHRVDDGAQNLVESVNMLKQAEEDGITTVVCTPHILKHSDFENTSLYFERLAELQEAATAENLNVKLYLGSEIYIQPEISFASPLATFNNNGRYFLVEFPMSSIPRFVAEMFFRFISDGKIPIIAHPERNLGFLQHPEFAYEFVQRGALLQLNAGSLRGLFGPEIQKLSTMLIDHHLIHFIASDCHHWQRRKCQLSKAYALVAEKWGDVLAQDLFIHNPQTIIDGKDFVSTDPRPIEKQNHGPWEKLVNGMKKFWK